MDFVTSRRAKIKSHTAATLSRQALEDALWDEGGIGKNIFGREARRRGGGILTHVPFHNIFILLVFSSLFLLLSSQLPSLRFLHVDAHHLSHLGTAVASSLSMVIGLLLSYRANQALKKWEAGRKIWTVDIKTEIRDSLRMISLMAPRPRSSSTPSTESTSPLSSSSTQAALDSSSPNLRRIAARRARQSVLESKAEELVCLTVAFAFALQHHLEKTKPLIHQPPLSDLLPQAYISSLKRTDSRVRFAQIDIDDEFDSSTGSEDEEKANENKDKRIGKRDRKRTRGKRGIPVQTRLQVSPLKDESQNSRNNTSPTLKSETTIQLEQLNVPPTAAASPSEDPTSTPHPIADSNIFPETSTPGSGFQTPRPKPVLSNARPPNLPLAVLRLMEGYVNEFVKAGEVDRRECAKEMERMDVEEEWESWGWTYSQGEKGWAMVRKLSRALTEAELLGENPPPLSLSIHLSHLLMIYILSIPLQLIHSLGRWSVLVAVVGGWALWGLEGISRELGGVFGRTSNHLPLSQYSNAILQEAITTPLFTRAYTARVRTRIGPAATASAGSGSGMEAYELDELRKIDEWTPCFAIM